MHADPCIIRLIAVEQSKEIHDTSGAEASFQVAWGKMLDGQPLVCAKTGTQFDAHPIPPSAAMLDVSRDDCKSKHFLTCFCSFSCVTRSMW